GRVKQVNLANFDRAGGAIGSGFDVQPMVGVVVELAAGDRRIHAHVNDGDAAFVVNAIGANGQHARADELIVGKGAWGKQVGHLWRCVQGHGGPRIVGQANIFAGIKDGFLPQSSAVLEAAEEQ